MNSRIRQSLAIAAAYCGCSLLGCSSNPGDDVPPMNYSTTCTATAKICPTDQNGVCVGPYVQQNVTADAYGKCIQPINQLQCDLWMCGRYCAQRPGCDRQTCQATFVPSTPCPANVGDSPNGGVPDSPYQIHGYEYTGSYSVFSSYTYEVPNELGVPVGMSAMESLFLLTNATSSTGTVEKLTAVQFSFVNNKVTATTGTSTDVGSVPASSLYTTWFNGPAGSDTSVHAIVGTAGSPYSATKYEILSGTINANQTRTVPVAEPVVQVARHPNAYTDNDMCVLTNSWLYYVDMIAGTVLDATQLTSSSGDVINGAVGATLGQYAVWVAATSNNQILRYEIPFGNYATPTQTASLAGAPVGIGGAAGPVTDETVIVLRHGPMGSALDTFSQGNILSTPITTNFSGTPVAMKAMTAFDQHWVWAVTSSPNNLYLFNVDSFTNAQTPYATQSLGALRPIGLYVSGSVDPIPEQPDSAEGSGGDGKDDSIGCPFAPNECGASQTGFVHVLGSLR